MAKLPTAAKDEGPPPVDPVARERSSAIGRAVMAGLGRPGDLLNVTVRQVAGNTYRVNVVTGADPTMARIAHSFFVAVDDQGNLLNSSPPLAKCY